MEKTFIYQDDKSNKFWTIETNGNEFTVTFGKTGTAGQTSSKSFDSEEKCLKEAEKLIKEKTKKGYVEQGENSLIAIMQQKAKTELPETAAPAKPKKDNKTGIEQELDDYIAKLVRKTSKRSDWATHDGAENIVFEVDSSGCLELEIGDYSLDAGNNAFWEYFSWFNLIKDKSSANYQKLVKASLLRLNATGQLKPLLKTPNTIFISTEDLPQLPVLTTDASLKNYLPAQEVVHKKDNEKTPLERFLDVAFPKRISKTPNKYEALRLQYLKDEISLETFAKQAKGKSTYEDDSLFSTLKNDHYKKLLDLMFTDKETYFPIFRKFIMAAIETHTEDAFFMLRAMALDEEDYGKKPRAGKMTPIEFLKQIGLSNFYVTELYFFQEMSLACADWLDKDNDPKPLQTFKAVSDAFPGIFKEYMSAKGLPGKVGTIMDDMNKKTYAALLTNYFEPSEENEETLLKCMMSNFSIHILAEHEKLGEALKDQAVINAITNAGIKEQVLEAFKKTSKDRRYRMYQDDALEVIGSVLVTSEFKDEKARVLYALMTKAMDLEDDWHDPYKILLETYRNWQIKGSVEEDGNRYSVAEERIATIKKFLDLSNPDAANSIGELIDFANAKQRRGEEYMKKNMELQAAFVHQITAIEKDKTRLFDFLSILADTPDVEKETLALLKEVCSKVEKATVQESGYDDGKYMTVTFPQKIKLDFSMPNEYLNSPEYADAAPHPISYMNSHLDHFSTIVGSDVYFYFGGTPYLEIADKIKKRLGLTRIICPCMDGKGGWIAHETDKNTSGNQKLYYLTKGEQRFSYETDFNAGTLFIYMLAEALGIKANIYKTEIVETKKKKQEKSKLNYTVTNQYTFSLKPAPYKDDTDEVYEFVKNELEEMAKNNEKISGFALATHDVADESCYLQGFEIEDGEIGNELFLEDFYFSDTKEDMDDYQEQVEEKYHIMAWALMKLQKEGAFDPVIKSFPFVVSLYMHDQEEEECFVLKQK